MEDKKLYRVNEGKMLLGVCAGFAEYFKVDPTIVRVIVVIAGLFGGVGLVAYLILALIMPLKG